MVKLLIIADDFTGALDTGVQFAKKGIETQVYTERKLNIEAISKTAQVLVVDSETRPLPGDMAYTIVKDIAKEAVAAGIPYLFKKTDSALRGNVGSELAAVLDAAGEQEIHFLPAYPRVHRVTRKGIHYIDGLLLENSPFGSDPFEPVTCSYIPKLIQKQTDYSVITVETKEPLPEKGAQKRICLLDAHTTEDIEKRTRELKERGKLRLLAGCAGLAEWLPKVLELEQKEPEAFQKTRGLYTACGSLNPITKAQIEYAVSKGYSRVDLTFEQKLVMGYYDTPKGIGFLKKLYGICSGQQNVIVNTYDWESPGATREYARANQINMEDIRYIISTCQGKIAKFLVEQGMEDTILMTGGDTLMGFMKEIGANQLHPIGEIGQGAVVSRLAWKGKNIQVVSKSGGYGTREIITDIAEALKK